jgi:hypothetical protein
MIMITYSSLYFFSIVVVYELDVLEVFDDFSMMDDVD